MILYVFFSSLNVNEEGIQRMEKIEMSWKKNRNADAQVYLIRESLLPANFEESCQRMSMTMEATSEEKCL